MTNNIVKQYCQNDTTNESSIEIYDVPPTEEAHRTLQYAHHHTSQYNWFSGHYTIILNL
jgi:hypothetical protein